MNFFKRPAVAVILTVLIVLCSTLVSINVKLQGKCDAVSDIFYEGVRVSGVDYPAMAEPMKQLCALTDDIILIAYNYGINTEALSQRLDELELVQGQVHFGISAFVKSRHGTILLLLFFSIIAESAGKSNAGYFPENGVNWG